MRRIALALILVASVAHAAEKLTLVFLDGKKKTLTLKSFDEAGLTAVVGGEDKTIPWKALMPSSAYKARKALTSYDDPVARYALAEFAVGLRLFPEGMEQLEIALALGALDEADFEKRAKEIEKLEVDYLCARIDQLLKSHREPHRCLEAIKRLKVRYPEHPNNAIYEPQVDKLVEALAKQVEKEQQQQEQVKDDAEMARLRKELDKLGKRKDKALATAAELFADSDEAIRKAQVSRIKKKLVDPSGAEKYYKKARGYMRKQARADSRFLILDKAALQKEYEDIEHQLVQCYLRVARMLIRQRNYKGAIKYVRNILYYDPINEEALEMVDEIKRNRISFRLSDITNARPRVTGG